MSQAKIIIQYTDGSPINELLKAVFEKMPEFSQQLADLKVIRGPKRLFSGGEPPALIAEMVFDKIKGEIPDFIEDFLAIAEAYNVDVKTIELKNLS